MINLSETIPLPRSEANTFFSSVPCEVGVALTLGQLLEYMLWMLLDDEENIHNGSFLDTSSSEQTHH